MRRFSILLLLTALCLAVPAQERKLSGRLVDSDTHENVALATVQLLKSDSTYISGAVTDAQGAFSIAAPRNGRFILKVSSVGYKTLCRNVEVAQDKNVALGKISFHVDAVTLKQTTVTAQASKVVLDKDTFIYNASAYRTPEGSTVEELVKRLPGAQVDDEGKITINGKEVKKIKVDGKEFMTGDTKTALKNLPTSIVNKIKAYDEKSDLSRVTGIDDGNEQTVLDFGVKPGMNKGLFGNADASYGTKDRFSERLMGAMFSSKVRTMLFGNANNTNDMGFPGGGGRGSFGKGRNGLNTSEMVGVNFNYDNNANFQFDGSVRWNHAGSDVKTKNSSENFVSTSKSFSNSINQSYSRTDNWNVQMRLEWKPDTLTNIMFRPTMSLSTTDGRAVNSLSQFNDDPYTYVSDPLSDASVSELAGRGVMVNTNRSSSISYGNTKSFGGMLQLNRRLNSLGRNVTLRADVNYNDTQSKNLSVSNVHLYQVTDRTGNDSTYQTNRYSITPGRKWNYSVQATYSEPLWRATFLQFSYKFNYSYTHSDRSTYDFSNLGESLFSGLTPAYRSWDSYLARLDNPYETYLDKALSRYSEYKNYTHSLELMFRMIRQNYQFNAGIMLQPQTSHFIQNYQGIHTDTTRTVMNITPTVDFRYKFSRVSSLRINYRATTSQPSMSDLLDITDDSDPLNITKGNPGLKPAFTNNFRAEYNNYLEKHQQAIMTSINFSTTRNSIGYKVTYDDKTGGRTTRPENINGNWNVSGMLIYNTAVDSTGCWNINTMTNLDYNNRVGYLSLQRNADAEKNITKTINVGERLGVAFRNSWLEVELDGSLQYMNTRNNLQQSTNLDTWQFAYGGTVNITCPWGTTLSTDLHQNSRRGYSDNSMNTNELVWNAQVAQGFLKSKALTVSLQFYDILANQSNFCRTVSAMSRSDTEYNSINSYAMLHVVYRFNLFGNKAARKEMRGRRDGEPGPPPGGMPMGGRPPRGGFGGPPPRF